MDSFVIYTPCSRHENLQAMYNSIVASCPSFTWIICFDAFEPKRVVEDDRIVYLAHRDDKSRSGNAQRNACIDYAQKHCDKDAWLYCLDDDNIIHKDLFTELMLIEPTVDFVAFGQLNRDKTERIRPPYVMQVGTCDSANFAVRLRVVGETRWELTRYEADGIFAEECSQKALEIKTIDKFISYYNSLRSNGKR